ncbi:hypothetical protein NHG33_06545 [Aerococcaceae bacterium NML130460]|nr:hypothetical protein [Aerococcaceae bacterium NML130460]
MELWLQSIVDKVIDMLLKRFEERLDEWFAIKQKRYLTQTEVKEEFDCNHQNITEWEEAGLRRFKKGRSVMYDRKDIEETFERLKY